MHILDGVTELKLQSELILERVRPLSEPGKRAWHEFVPFVPGQEHILEELHARISFIMHSGELPSRVKDAFKGITQVDFLMGDYRQWGRAEISHLSHLLQRYAVIASWNRALPGSPWSLDWEPHPLLSLVEPHIGTDGAYAFKPACDDHERLLAALGAAVDYFEKVSTEEREQVAKALGVAPARLRTDLVVNANELETLELIKGIAQLHVVETTPWQMKFRYFHGDGVEEARRGVQVLRRELADAERSAIASLSQVIAPHCRLLGAQLRQIGEMDLVIARAALAREMNAVCPKLAKENENIELKSGVNPMLESELARRNLTCQPVSCQIHKKIVTIAGANMGGKSSFLRLMGLLQVMTQYGLFVPAAKFVTSLYQRIAWCGATDDNLTAGLSSFGNEIVRLSNVLKSDVKTLLLVDEFARSTSFEEGRDLALGLMTYFGDTCDGKLLLAGHIRALGEVEFCQALQTAGLNRKVLTKLSEGNSVDSIARAMDYSIIAMTTARQGDAFLIANMLGLPFKPGNGA